MTSFVFKVGNQPAALNEALGGFATNGVNKTKLESYMVNGELTAAQFLAEVNRNPNDAGLARALDELSYGNHQVGLGADQVLPMLFDCGSAAWQTSGRNP